MANSSTAGREIHGQAVRGVAVGAETRCGHWHGPTDIIALRMKCCGEWFSCYDCHAALADHAPQVWTLEERDTAAILCGAPRRPLTPIRAGIDSRAPLSESRFTGPAESTGRVERFYP